MKRLLIPTLVLMVTSFGLINVFAGETGAKKDSKADVAVKPANKGKSDANSVKEANEPNVPKEDKLTEFKEDFDKIKESGTREAEAWTARTKNINKSRFLQAAQSQVGEELSLLKKVAAAEGAAKTVIAIDRMIQLRQERIDEIEKALEEEKKEERLKEKEQRDAKGRKRLGRQREVKERPSSKDDAEN